MCHLASLSCGPRSPGAMNDQCCAVMLHILTRKSELCDFKDCIPKHCNTGGPRLSVYPNSTHCIIQTTPRVYYPGYCCLMCLTLWNPTIRRRCCIWWMYVCRLQRLPLKASALRLASLKNPARLSVQLIHNLVRLIWLQSGRSMKPSNLVARIACLPGSWCPFSRSFFLNENV